MPDVGVFRSNDGKYFTCCCRVVILNDYTYCPRCKQRVISPINRYTSTIGAESLAVQGRVRDRYAWSGRMQSAKVAARLKGEIFVMPALCVECAHPVDDCECHVTEWEE